MRAHDGRVKGGLATIPGARENVMNMMDRQDLRIHAGPIKPPSLGKVPAPYTRAYINQGNMGKPMQEQRH